MKSTILLCEFFRELLLNSNKLYWSYIEKLWIFAKNQLSTSFYDVIKGNFFIYLIDLYLKIMGNDEIASSYCRNTF